jgi:hypothetical protein
MRLRRSIWVLAGLAVFLLWRRASRSGERVEVLYDDGSQIRLERGVEADDLLDDARELLALLA